MQTWMFSTHIIEIRTHCSPIKTKSFAILPPAHRLTKPMSICAQLLLNLRDVTAAFTRIFTSFNGGWLVCGAVWSECAIMLVYVIKLRWRPSRPPWISKLHPFSFNLSHSLTPCNCTVIQTDASTEAYATPRSLCRRHWATIWSAAGRYWSWYQAASRL